ncbi:MAG: hypothetical protein K6V97_14760 [Actinomycetia bacterium]|nr:hypothetical protein [Actinomycetes bacterium]
MFSWAPLRGRRSDERARPIPSLRTGPVALSHGHLTIAWWLGPGNDPQRVRDVHFRAGTEMHRAEVVPVATEQPHCSGGHGVFRCPLPDVDPPWVLEGEGPDGPWREELDLDPLLVRDYRNAFPVDQADEHDGVRLVVERVAARPERLTIFYAVSVGGTEVSDPGAVGMRRLHREGTTYPAQPPPLSSWPPKRTLRGMAAHFVGQPPGSEVAFEVSRVLERRHHPVEVRLAVPTTLPAVLEPDCRLPTGHRLVEAVFTKRGTVLRFAPGQAAGGHLLLGAVTTDGGRLVEPRGGVGGEEESVVVLGRLPEGATSLIFSEVETQVYRPGPWRVRFVVP